MAGLIKLSLAALRSHPWRTALLIGATALVLALPLLAERVFSSWQAAMFARADATPMVLGPRAGRLDLLLDGLFLRPAQSELRQEHVRQATAGLDLRVLPVHLRHGIAGTTLVGTDLDYLRFRQLAFAEGKPFLRIGDCVIGNTVAARLGISPGDTLTSAPHGLLDPTTGTTLRLRVTGILTANGSVDDERVFCDIKTSWVLDGIGHGHIAADKGIHSSKRNEVGSDMVLRDEVDDPDAFHFHGDPDNFPLTAAIIIPAHSDEAVLLQGRLADSHLGLQALDSRVVLQDVVAFTMRFGDFAGILLTMVLIAAGILLLLIGLLASRLRAEEFATLAALGLRRREIGGIIICEWLVVLLTAALLAICISILAETVLLETLEQIVITWQS